MRVYLGQQLRALLYELTRYADTLLKIADKNITTCKSSMKRRSRLAEKPNKSYAHTVMSDDGDGQKNKLVVPPKMRDSRYDDSCQSSTPSSCDKKSCCLVCMKKTH